MMIPDDETVCNPGREKKPSHVSGNNTIDRNEKGEKSWQLLF